MRTLATRSAAVLALAFGLLNFATAADSPSTTPMTRPESDGPQAKALHAFIAREKFEPTVFNPVQRSEPGRLRLQAVIDALATRLLPLADQPRDKPRVLAEFRRSMADIPPGESEDKEQAAGYMEELMDILGIDSSDGLLNTWVYGFDPNATR
jgi:hypothetical protein